MADKEAEHRELVKERVMELDEEGRQAFTQEDYSRARQMFEQAAEACQSIGWQEEQIYQLLHVTQAMAHEPGYFPSLARPILDEALSLALATGLPSWILPVQIQRIRLDIEEGRCAVGLRQIQASLKMALEASLEDFIGSLILFAAFACVGIEHYEAALYLNSAAQAERDRLGEAIPQRAQRESIERNLAPARRAFPPGKRSAIEAVGYQMSQADAANYVLTIQAPEEELNRRPVMKKKTSGVRPV
jgi:hypothetical protein